MDNAQLRSHYEALWEKSLPNFNAGKPICDPLLGSARDNRYGVTLRARPSQPTQYAISRTLELIKAVAPELYYYPDTDLHLTVLSLISCRPGFSLEQINPAGYIGLVRSAAQSIAPFKVTFSGLTASPEAVLVRGFPQDRQLHHLRNTLREKFHKSGLVHTIDQRYALQTAHMTVVRFPHPVISPKPFVQALECLKETHFGECLIDELELVGNDWYQQHEKVQVLAKFKL